MKLEKRLISTNFVKTPTKKYGICIHTMVGTLSGTDSFFRNPAAKVSSHYGVDLTTDSVYQWVEEGNIAWAQGRISGPTNKLVLDKGGDPNEYFISIECADSRNPAGADRSLQTKTVAELVADIVTRNNIPLDRDHVCGHREIYDKKSCPGNLNIDQIVEMARDIISGMADNLLDPTKDLPAWLEDMYGLKDKAWYDKRGNFGDVVKKADSLYSNEQILNKRIETLDKKVLELNAKVLELNKKLSESSPLQGEVDALKSKLSKAEAEIVALNKKIANQTNPFEDFIKYLVNLVKRS